MSDPQPQPVTIENEEQLAQAAVLAIGSLILALTRRYVRNLPDVHRASDRRVARPDQATGLTRSALLLQMLLELSRPLIVVATLLLALVVGLLGVFLDPQNTSTWAYLVRPEGLAVALWALFLWRFPVCTPELEGNRFQSFQHAVRMSTSWPGLLLYAIVCIPVLAGSIAVLLWKQAYGSAGISLATVFVLTLGLEPWAATDYSHVYSASYQRWVIPDVPDVQYRNYYVLEEEVMWAEAEPSLRVFQRMQGPLGDAQAPHNQLDKPRALLGPVSSAPWSRELLSLQSNAEDALAGFFEQIAAAVQEAGPGLLPGATVDNPRIVSDALKLWSSGLCGMLSEESSALQLHISTVWVLAVMVSVVEDVGTVWTDVLFQDISSEDLESGNGDEDVAAVGDERGDGGSSVDNLEGGRLGGLAETMDSTDSRPDLPFSFVVKGEDGTLECLGHVEPTVNRWGININALSEQTEMVYFRIEGEHGEERLIELMIGRERDRTKKVLGKLGTDWTAGESRLLDCCDLLSSEDWMYLGTVWHSNPFIGQLGQLAFVLARDGSGGTAQRMQMETSASTRNGIKRCADTVARLSVIAAGAGVSIGMLSVVVQEIL